MYRKEQKTRLSKTEGHRRRKTAEGEKVARKRARSALRKINISIREVQRNRPFIYVGPYERRCSRANLVLLPFPTRRKVC